MKAGIVAAALSLTATAAAAQGDATGASPERAPEPEGRRLELAARMRDLKASLDAGVVDGVYRGRITKKMFGWDSGDGIVVREVDVDGDGVAFKGTVIGFEVTWGLGDDEGSHHHRFFYRNSLGTDVQSWRGIEGVQTVRYVAPGLGTTSISHSWERCRSCVALETRRKAMMISFSSRSAMAKFTSALQSFLDLRPDRD